jgi:hypothetical protein
MIRIGVAANLFHLTSDARCWGVAGIILRECAINVLSLRVINVRTKRIFDGP